MISIGPVTCGTGGSEGFTYGTGARSVGAGAVTGAGAGAGAGAVSGVGAVVAGALAHPERIANATRDPRTFLVVVMDGWSS